MADSNLFENKGKAVIHGKHVAFFALTCPAVVLLAVYLVPPHQGQNGLLLPLLVVFGIGLIGIAISVSPLGDAALPALGFVPVRRRFYLIGILGTLALSLVMSQFGIEAEGMKEALKVGGGLFQMVAALLVMALLAPLVEELLFRGLLYGWIENRWSGLAAFIVTSILFALAHFEPEHITLVAPLAVFFGWLRWHTGSIWPSLVAHVVNNAVAVLAAAYVTS